MSTVALTFVRPTSVQQPLHVVERPDEGEFEREQLDRKLEPAFRRVASDLMRGVDHELPLALRRQQALLEHVLAGDEAEVAGGKLGREVDDVPRPLDVIRTDRGIEVAEAEQVQTSETTGKSTLRTSPGYLRLSSAAIRPGSKPMKRSAAVESDFPRFFSSWLPFVLRAEPGRIDQAELPLRMSCHWIASSLDKTIRDDHFHVQGLRRLPAGPSSNFPHATNGLDLDTQSSAGSFCWREHNKALLLHF